MIYNIGSQESIVIQLRHADILAPDVEGSRVTKNPCWNQYRQQEFSNFDSD